MAVRSAVLVFAAAVATSSFAIAARADSAVSAPAATASPAASGACSGVAMTAGQPDIDANDSGTTFCITGTHSWSLVPKDGDVFIGGTLDGGGTLAQAFSGKASKVTVSNVRVSDYNPSGLHGAIDATGDGWTLRNVIVSGSALAGIVVGGSLWQITGGRIYDNGRLGIRGIGRAASKLTIDGVELDHNGFVDSTYTTRKVSCRYGSGGVKFQADNVTIRNSYVHDNACQGIWSSLGADRITVVDNRVDGNWDEGMLIDITGNATVSGNEVSGNGFHDSGGTAARPCGSKFGQGSGIAVNTSGQIHTVTGTIDVGSNTVSSNCNGITGVEQARTSVGCSTDPACELRNVTVHDNTIVGSDVPGAGNQAGWSAEDGSDLTTHNLAWVNNDVSAGIVLTLLTTSPSTSTTTTAPTMPTSTTTVPTTTTTTPVNVACTRFVSAPSSISSAESAANPGDVVCLHGGTYSEIVHLSHSGTASAPITVQSAPGERAVIDGTGLNPGGGLFDISAAYVDVRALTIQNSSHFGVANYGHHDLIQGCLIWKAQRAGLITTGYGGGENDHNTYDHNEVTQTVLSNLNDAYGSGGWDSAVNNYGGGGANGFNTYTNNLVHDNWGEGQTATNNDVLRSNTYHDNWGTDVYIDNKSFVTIEQNLIYESETSYIGYNGQSWRLIAIGIGLGNENAPATSTNNVIRNNFVINTRRGIDFYNSGYATDRVQNDTFDNNTFVNTWENVIQWSSGPHSGDRFTNNVFYPRSGVDEVSIGTPGNTTFTGNVFYSPGGSSTGKFNWNGVTTDFAGWAQQVSNVWADPGITAAGSFSFNPSDYRATNAIASGKGAN